MATTVGGLIVARGQNDKQIIGEVASRFAPMEDNVNSALYTANVSSAGPGSEVTIQIPCGDTGPGQHTVWSDVVLEFQVAEPGDDLDIIVRSGAALVRDIRLSLDSVEVAKVDTAFELDLIFRESLRALYDPRNLKCAGWVPPSVDASTGSVCVTGFEVYPPANTASYAFKRSSIPGVAVSPYRHRFQLSLATAFGPLLRDFDPRRHKQLEVRMTFLPATNIAEWNRAIAFSANTGDYASISFTNIAARVYRQSWWRRPPALRLSTKDPLCHVMYQYDFATVPVDLTVAGQLTVQAAFNNLFPVRQRCTRLLWTLAPPAPTDSSTLGFMYENSAAVNTLHTPVFYELSYQGSAVQRVSSGFEIERMRSTWQRKQHKTADEYSMHPSLATDFANLSFADLTSAYQQTDPGVVLLNGIEVGSFGSAAAYTIQLSTVPYRPALSGGPTQLVLILESIYTVHQGPGDNSGGPMPQVKVVGA